MAKRPRRLSRPKRWADAVSRAQAAISDLIDVWNEYKEWDDNLPDNFRSTALDDKLADVVNLDLEEAQNTIEEAAGIDLPLGFGRD